MRLFIGLAPNPALRREAADFAAYFSARMPGKSVEPDNYHITLAFLGEISDEAVPAVERCMNAAAARVKPFAYSIQGVNAFGKPEHGILHLTVRDSGETARAASLLREALSGENLPFDPKPFCAHITLARNVRYFPQTLPFLPRAVSCASGFTLFHSTWVSDEPKYIPIRFSAFTAPSELPDRP